MRSATLITLLAFVAWGYAEEEVATNDITDLLVDKLIVRTLNALNLQKADLDSSTLGKPGHLQASASAYHDNLARSIPDQQDSSFGREQLDGDSAIAVSHDLLDEEAEKKATNSLLMLLRGGHKKIKKFVHPPWKQFKYYFPPSFSQKPPSDCSNTVLGYVLPGRDGPTSKALPNGSYGPADGVSKYGTYGNIMQLADRRLVRTLEPNTATSSAANQPHPKTHRYNC